MKKKGKKWKERTFSYNPPSTDQKKPKMAATSTGKEQEVGKGHSGPLDDVLKQIVDSIQSLGDRLENKIEQLQTDMDCFRLEIKENLDGGRGSRILKWGVNFCNNVIEPINI